MAFQIYPIVAPRASVRPRSSGLFVEDGGMLERGVTGPGGGIIGFFATGSPGRERWTKIAGAAVRAATAPASGP
jgi:hypothetical protein